MKKFRTPLYTSLTINTFLVILEFSIGLTIGSIALIGDGFNNLADSILLVIALFTDILAKRCNDYSKKIRLYGSIVSISTLVVISLYLLDESFKHLHYSRPINGLAVSAVALAAIAINLTAAYIIRNNRRIPERASFFSLLTSAFSGSSVLFSGLMISAFKAQIFDFITGLSISLVLMFFAVKLSLKLLLGEPKKISKAMK